MKMVVLILMIRQQMMERIKSPNTLVSCTTRFYYYVSIVDAVQVTVTCPFCSENHDKADSRIHKVDIQLFLFENLLFLTSLLAEKLPSKSKECGKEKPTIYV
jgi:hypothetical protein